MATHNIINSSTASISDGEFFLSHPLTILLTACTHPCTRTNTPPNYRFDGVTELKKETPLIIEKLFPSLFQKDETKPSN